MSNRWWMLAVVFVTRTSMGFQFQSIASVGPLLVRDFGWSYSSIGWLIGLYMLPGVVFALPGGLLGQRLGDRRVVVAGLALMVVGGVVTAHSDSFAVAALARLASGIGAVLMNILLAKMVADWFTGKELSTAMAVMLTAWPVGLGVAAATLGAIAARFSWRVAVDVTAVAAVIGLLLMELFYRDAPRGGPVSSLSDSPSNLSQRELLLSGIGGLTWGVFNVSLIAVISFGPAFLVTRGMDIGNAGLVVSLSVWVTFLSVPLGGYLNDRLKKPNLLIVAGSLVAAVVMLLLPRVPEPALGFGLIGLVVGAPSGAIMALLPQALRRENLATGFGVYYTVFYFCMAVGQPAAGFVRDASGNPAGPIVFAAAVMAATAVGLAVFRRIEREDACA